MNDRVTLPKEITRLGLKAGTRVPVRVVIWAGTRVRFYYPGTRVKYLHDTVYKNASAKNKQKIS